MTQEHAELTRFHNIYCASVVCQAPGSKGRMWGVRSHFVFGEATSGEAHTQVCGHSPRWGEGSPRPRSVPGAPCSGLQMSAWRVSLPLWDCACLPASPLLCGSNVWAFSRRPGAMEEDSYGGEGHSPVPQGPGPALDFPSAQQAPFVLLFVAL